jgi:hypothetical protein
MLITSSARIAVTSLQQRPSKAAVWTQVNVALQAFFETFDRVPAKTQHLIVPAIDAVESVDEIAPVRLVPVEVQY